MRDRSLGAVIADRSDVELAAIFERIWESRGYETHVTFHGTDVHVEAEGETTEGAHRAVRIWISTTKRVTADKTSAFVRNCDHAGEEPYVAAIGRGRLEDDAHRPGLVELDAPTIAVEVREAGIESFVRDMAASTDRPQTNWLGDPIEDGDESGEEEASNADTSDEDDDAISRREALKKASQYVVGGFVTYLVVERISDLVQQSPAVRAAIARRVAWVDSRLPDIELPSVEWSLPEPQPLYEDGPQSNTTTTASTLDDASVIPYGDLRTDPDSYTGTSVTYAGRVSETLERKGTRLATVTVENDAGKPRGDVVIRWPTGQFFDNDVSFRLLEGERVRFWGVVAGEGSISGGVTYPRIDVSVLEEA
ncbi:hypothetical protein GJR96_07900 [Haloferax sp. MBLA0076]|uniref:Uncharacterized protein n=1 Tax=Haloferax litoreum TaxID=2666140 RepID=A0A6A8GFE4_9EURY|nr:MULTISPECIES: hypothetical protein [Haloferax]KAB1193370.1 hypothetical protein Hfx1148_07895 [Haloferax sp. CBA1148]MRX21878.1 hypothetical protein [Haloferax litoreum]